MQQGSTNCFIAFLVASIAVAKLTPTADDFEKLRSQVVGSAIFVDKVKAACQGRNSRCNEEAQGKLFCALLRRSRPEMAASHCDSRASLVQKLAVHSRTASSVELETLKSKVMGSQGFQNEVAKISESLGCAGVKQASACSSYVNEAAFCLAFADQFPKFAALPGAKAQVTSCTKIDQTMPELSLLPEGPPGFVQVRSSLRKSRKTPKPEDQLATEMTHDLEVNFNKIAPFGKEDTAKELQSHAAKTQDTLVDAVENAEVAEIKRAVFRALTRLRAATIKEFDTIARLETQAIDAYNDAHHYRAENPLSHLHEDEAPVETDKLKSFH
jgi:hypothetical protein